MTRTPQDENSPDLPGDSEDQAANASSPEFSLDADGPDMAAFEAALGSEDTHLAQAVGQLEEAKEDLARARADVYNLNQEYGNYVRRAKADAGIQRQRGQEEVAESLLSVLDDIEAARTAGELLEGPFAAIAAKLEETLKSKFGLERFGAEGEDFDPQLHEALMAQTNPDVDHPVIKQVLQPGYRVKEKVLRATKVMVDNPE